MIRLLFYVVGVALLVVAAVWLANEPGSVALVWHGWRVDTSMGVLITALVVLLAIAFAFSRLVGAVARTMQAFAERRRERRLSRGLTSLGDGFAAVLAGQRDTARKLAGEAERLLKDNTAVLILRKEAAALEGDDAAVEAAARAMVERPETALAGLRTLATAAFDVGNVARAEEYARRAWTKGDAPWALRMLLDINIGTESWDDALALLDGRSARLAFSASEHARLRTLFNVRVAMVALARGDSTTATVAAKRALGVDAHNRSAVVVFARAMAAQGKGRKAAATVERAWAEAPHADLLAAYRGLVPGETALDWAKRVESLVEAKPEDPESRLAAAEAALAAELWGQARNRLSGLTAEHMDASVRARAARLLAELESRQRGDAEAAADWLKVALEFHHAALPTARPPRSVAELLARSA